MSKLPRRLYVDSFLRAKTVDEACRMIERAKILGYSMIGVATEDFEEAQFKETAKFAREKGIDIFRRIDMVSDSKHEMIRKINHSRKNCEIVSILCRTREATLFAARDGRVDFVQLPLASEQRIDKHVASVFKNMLEIVFSDLLEHDSRIETFRPMMKIVHEANRYKVKTVMSSGASDIYGMRSPVSLAESLESLGASRPEAILSVSEYPYARVMLNRERMGWKK